MGSARNNVERGVFIRRLRELVYRRICLLGTTSVHISLSLALVPLLGRIPRHHVLLLCSIEPIRDFPIGYPGRLCVAPIHRNYRPQRIVYIEVMARDLRSRPEVRRPDSSVPPSSGAS